MTLNVCPMCGRAVPISSEAQVLFKSGPNPQYAHLKCLEELQAFFSVGHSEAEHESKGNQETGRSSR